MKRPVIHIDDIAKRMHEHIVEAYVSRGDNTLVSYEQLAEIDKDQLKLSIVAVYDVIKELEAESTEWSDDDTNVRGGMRWRE